jgi:hypothetical protein
LKKMWRTCQSPREASSALEIYVLRDWSVP